MNLFKVTPVVSHTSSKTGVDLCSLVVDVVVVDAEVKDGLEGANAAHDVTRDRRAMVYFMVVKLVY